MLSLDQIFKLIDAGYTKEDIQTFTTTTPEPAKPAEEAPADPAPSPKETSKPKAAEPQPEQTAQAQPAAQDQILQALERLTNSIMQHNTNSTVIQPAEHSIDDALAEIIAPKANKGR